LCTPKSGGAFHHHLVMLQTPLFWMYREKFSLPLHIQGMSPPDMLGIGIPMSSGREARFWGVCHEDHSLPSTLPGALDARIMAGHFQLVIFVQLKVLESMLSGRLVEALVRAAQRHLLQVPSPALRRFSAWANYTLDRVGPAHTPTEPPIAMEAVYRELVNNLAMLAAAMTPATDVSTNAARQLGLQRALEYLRDDHSSNVSLPELCRIAGVSERSLQYAFREAFGLTPLELMTRRRLHAARQELVTSERTGTSVTHVAMKFGFLELGRFASIYQRAFGELPSETLLRPI
jgi:AraC family ethanolamine operon transcriptional activator